MLTFLRDTTLEAEVLTDRDRAAASQVAANRAIVATQAPEIVYYLRVDGLIKIGTSRDLARRLEEYPPSAVVLGVELGGRDVEQCRLAQFGGARASRREWFHPSGRLTAHIQALPPLMIGITPVVEVDEPVGTTDLYGGLMSVKEAAHGFGVGRETIRRWVKLDYLPVAARDGRGRPLFRWIDVAIAEKGRRDTGKSVPLRQTVRAA